MRMFSTREGDAGFALKGNDIVSVFKHPKAPYRNVTRSMLDLAKQEGGQRLDAFDTVLPHIYAQNGFRAVARLPWNEEHKPKGWMRDTFREFNGGTPDVVFMAHDPQAGSYQPGDGRRIADYDEGELHQRAALAHVAARGNVPAQPGPEAYGSGQLIRSANPLTAWHGTPHEFGPTRVNPLGEFSMAKIGAGEGNQAYGRGIYQAQAKGTAEEYRNALSPPGKVSPEFAKALREEDKLGFDTVGQAVAAMRQHADWRDRWDPADPDRLQRLLDEHLKQSGGHLYESQIHIDPEHMLHWNKPISEHSPYVQHRVRGLYQVPDGIAQQPDGRWAVTRNGRPTSATRVDSMAQAQFSLQHENNHHKQEREGLTGEHFYRRLEARFHPSVRGEGRTAEQPELAAKALLDAGIPGIRYHDANSRGHAAEAQRLQGRLTMMRLGGYSANDIAREEQQLREHQSRISHNYVVFDPRTINIVRRNGLPSMVDAGADALRDHKARS